MEEVMRVLSNRQLKILMDLDADDVYITGPILSSKHGVSLRTIQNDLTEIKSITHDFDFMTIVSVPSKGNKMIVNDRFQYKRFIEDQTTRQQTQALDSREERIRKIIALLFSLKKSISVQHMADRLFVSKSTLINDLKEVKEIFSKYDLAVCNKPQHGLYIKGEEQNIRMCIIKENVNVYYAFNEFMVMGQISEHLPKIRDIVVNALTEYEYRISDVALQNLIIHIDIIIRRIENGFFLEFEYNEAFMHELSKEIEIAELIFEPVVAYFQLRN